MSKLVETRFEYACYDGASLSASPPSYPPVLDQYQAGSIATTAESYGVVPVTSTGPSVSLYSIPAGATLTIVCDAGNTTLCGVTAGGAVFSAGPQGIVTVPGNLVALTPTLAAYSTSLAVLSNTPFSAQILWNL